MKELLLLLTIASALLAEQNTYTSLNQRVAQEAKDSVKVHPKRDLGTKPHNLHQSLKNSMYEGSDTKGYKLDAKGNDVKLGG